ncbi:MAG TPA: hypothetical protein VIQ97_05805 [Prevotella sp.]
MGRRKHTMGRLPPIQENKTEIVMKNVHTTVATTMASIWRETLMNN